ncbi:hypothetical protein BH11ARM2_BH11ARM2_09980 [soil metagenome]
MVAERQTLEEMSRRYDGEWILIGDPELDREGNPASGTVLAHSRERDEVYDQAARIKPAFSAFWSFIPWPDDTVFVL